MGNLLGKTKMFFNRNSSMILTCVGGVGVIATAIAAAKATPKAIKLVEELEKEKGEELTTPEIIYTAAPAYIPTVLIGASTIACIFGANTLNKRQQASLMSAYALVDSSFKEYKGKLKEMYGEETHQSIVDAIAVEKAEKMNITSAYMVGNCDLSTEEGTGDPILFYDEHSNRYFESTIEQVMSAEYHLNRNYVLRGYSYLNEFYEFLGLETTDYGSVLGWAPNDDGMYWIEFNHRKTILDDGLEVYIIEMPFEPTYDFLEY